MVRLFTCVQYLGSMASFTTPLSTMLRTQVQLIVVFSSCSQLVCMPATTVLPAIFFEQPVEAIRAKGLAWGITRVYF
jgi:hypothetical protein